MGGSRPGEGTHGGPPQNGRGGAPGDPPLPARQASWKDRDANLREQEGANKEAIAALLLTPKDLRKVLKEHSSKRAKLQQEEKDLRAEVQQAEAQEAPQGAQGPKATPSIGEMDAWMTTRPDLAAVPYGIARQAYDQAVSAAWAADRAAAIATPVPQQSP